MSRNSSLLDDMSVLLSLPSWSIYKASLFVCLAACFSQTESDRRRIKSAYSVRHGKESDGAGFDQIHCRRLWGLSFQVCLRGSALLPTHSMHEQTYTWTVLINRECFDREGQRPNDLKGVYQRPGGYRIYLAVSEQREESLNTWILQGPGKGTHRVASGSFQLSTRYVLRNTLSISIEISQATPGRSAIVM